MFSTKIEKHYITSAIQELTQIYTLIAASEKISPLVLLATTSNLLSTKINFVVAGGFARSIHATPRATGDVDIIIAIKNMAEAKKLLTDNGFVHKDVLEYSKPTRTIIKFELQGRELDIIEYSDSSFVDFLLSTSIKHNMLGVSYSFLGLEGVVLTKLCSFRYKDKADLVDILRDKKPDLDVVKSWCSKLGIMDRFSFLLEKHED